LSNNSATAQTLQCGIIGEGEDMARSCSSREVPLALGKFVRETVPDEKATVV